MSVQQDIIHRLQQEILKLQGSRPPAPGQKELGLGPILAAFPHQNFPTGAIHEFVCASPAGTAATAGFTAGLLSGLMRQGGVCIWVSASRKIYPPGLKTFGIAPDRVIFMDMRTEKEVLWVMEEALKCEGLAAVVGEMKEMDMTVSRRFQLATEQSRVTGFVLRQQPKRLIPTAAVARWHVTHCPGVMGPRMGGSGLSGPVTAGLVTAGLTAEGPVSASPAARGPVMAGLVTEGPVTEGPAARGPATAGPATAGADPAVPAKAASSMPGLSFPRWNIELSRIRNGHPGSWVVEWQAGQFHFPGEKAGLSAKISGQAESARQPTGNEQAVASMQPKSAIHEKLLQKPTG